VTLKLLRGRSSALPPRRAARADVEAPIDAAGSQGPPQPDMPTLLCDGMVTTERRAGPGETNALARVSIVLPSASTCLARAGSVRPLM